MLQNIMNANRHSYWARKSAEGRLMARESNRVQYEKRRTRTVPDDTLLMRARSDAKMRSKGQVIREGVTYKSTGEIAWSIARSIQGRINQLDVIVNGSVWATAGARRLRTKGIPI